MLSMVLTTPVVVLLGLMTGFILHLVLREMLPDFSSPLAEQRSGSVNILALYVIGGFFFSLSSKLPLFGDIDLPAAAIVLAALGLGVVGLARLLSLAYSLTASLTARRSTLIADGLVMGIPGAFMGLFVISRVTSLEGFVSSVAPMQTEAFSTQSLSLFLLIGGAVVMMGVEVCWAFWSRWPPLQKVIRDMIWGSFLDLCRRDPSQCWHDLLETIVKRRDRWTLDELQDHLGIDDAFKVRGCMRLLVQGGQVVGAADGTWVARHPHYYRYQGELMFKFDTEYRVDKLSCRHVEYALRNYYDFGALERSALSAFPGIASALSGFDSRGAALHALLSAAFKVFEALATDGNAVTGEQYKYLHLRYLEKKSIHEIAKELGYSREYVTRKYHKPAMQRFKGILGSRLHD